MGGGGGCGVEVVMGQRWGDVGLGPLSDGLVMEADKGCGAEGVEG